MMKHVHEVQAEMPFIQTKNVQQLERALTGRVVHTPPFKTGGSNMNSEVKIDRQMTNRSVSAIED